MDKTRSLSDLIAFIGQDNIADKLEDHEPELQGQVAWLRR